MEGVRPRLTWMPGDDRVAFTCIDPATFHRQVSLMGVVEQMHDDTDRADIDVLSQMYVGTPAPRTAHPRISVRVRVER